MYTCLLFDLDGTISDPKIGITRSVQYALHSFGIEEPDLDRLEPFIGPPLRDSFMQFYGFSAEQAQQGVEKYRERFAAQGLYENALYPGMGELLRSLKQRGCRLAVASSKPTVYVEQILQYFGIRQYFEVVVGSELNGLREKKEEVIAETLRRLFGEGGVDYARTVMIGDREYDIHGAGKLGLHTIGVSYGYAAAGELERAGAELIVQSVEGLRRVLLPEGAGSTEADRRQREDPARRYRSVSAQGNRGGMPKSMPGSRAVWIKPCVQSALALALYACAAFLMVSVLTTAYMLIRLLVFQQGMTLEEQNIVLNVVNGLANLTAAGVCVAIWKEDSGWKTKKRVEKVSLIPMVVLAAAAAVAFNALISLSGVASLSPEFQRVASLQSSIPAWLDLLLAGVVAPVAEELVFRGLLYSKLKRAFGTVWGILLSAVLFGLIHGNLVQFLYAAAMGVLLAWVCEIYGSVKYAMLFHGAANIGVILVMQMLPVGYIILFPAAWLSMLLLAAVCGYFVYRWQVKENPSSAG